MSLDRTGGHRRTRCRAFRPTLGGGLETALSPEELRASQAMKLPNPDAEFRKLNMVGNAVALASELKPLAARGLEVTFTGFPDETHNSVIPAYLSRGARFALSGWLD